MYYEAFVEHCQLSKNARIKSEEGEGANVLAYYDEGLPSCTWLCLSCLPDLKPNKTYVGVVTLEAYLEVQKMTRRLMLVMN